MCEIAVEIFGLYCNPEMTIILWISDYLILVVVLICFVWIFFFCFFFIFRKERMLKYMLYDIIIANPYNHRLCETTCMVR